MRTDASTSILVNIVGVECRLAVVQASVSEDYENIYGRLTFCKKHLKQLFQGFKKRDRRKGREGKVGMGDELKGK